MPTRSKFDNVCRWCVEQKLTQDHKASSGTETSSSSATEGWGLTHQESHLDSADPNSIQNVRVHEKKSTSGLTLLCLAWSWLGIVFFLFLWCPTLVSLWVVSGSCARHHPGHPTCGLAGRGKVHVCTAPLKIAFLLMIFAQVFKCVITDCLIHSLYVLSQWPWYPSRSSSWNRLKLHNHWSRRSLLTV